MTHQSEFQEPSQKNTDAAARAMAARYARVFLGSDDGKLVLEDLRKKFGLKRLTFTRGQPHRFDPISAAIIDGERGVMAEIEGALEVGAPGQAQALQEKTKTTV